MPSRNTDDPQHWRDRAAKMRALALTMDDQTAVTLMSDLADDYDKIAEKAVRRNEEKQPKNSLS